MNSNINIQYSLKEVTDKYGFKEQRATNSLSLMAKDTNGHWIRWVTYDIAKDTIYLDNTDCLNIWLCDTRPDLTPEQIIEFVKELNSSFGFEGEDRLRLKELIDPEDWQEIAQVQDASADKRYTEN